jgi:amino acid adenylation domain-containing protein
MLPLLHQNLEQRACSQPESESFCCGTDTITFAELDQRSSKLAGLLHRQGVVAGDLVGIRLPPCIESAVAVYGILKAGAAFVPIDPNAPDKRCCEILQLGNIRHLIAGRFREQTLDYLADSSHLEVVISQQELAHAQVRHVPWGEIDGSTEMLPIRTDIDDLAYVIFTSGSTGTPKGILHTHFSGQSYAQLSKSTYGVVPTDRIANFSPLHFDMSTFGYLTSVLAGATTILIPPAYTKVPASLSQLIQDQRVTIWYSVPFALIQLLERGVPKRRDLSQIRWILYGGEPFAARHINRLREHCPAATVSNVYGPAEVNQCTYHHIPPTLELADDEAIPIGTIWQQTDGLIIDENDQPVPTGAAGELLIHSTTMMKRLLDGHEHDPQTFFVTKGKRYYRTGDIARENAEGQLLFLGRMDRQVKLRGYRIELDEIERAVNRHSEVEEAAAVVIGLSDQQQALALCVLTTRDAQVAADDLRSFLARELPSYSIPEKIVLLDDFPRTSSGKIDRRLLKDNLQQGGPDE